MTSPLRRPTLFFDRDVGIRLPQALRLLRLPVDIEYHQNHFPGDAKDEEWMPAVGRRGWTLIGHDGQHHLVAAERSAILDYRIGCFYLWGNSARLWQKMRCFLRGFEGVLEAVQDTDPPFVFKVREAGRLEAVEIR